MRENTGGTDFASAIYVTGKTSETDSTTGNHKSTQATVNILVNSDEEDIAKLFAVGWSTEKKLGIYTGYISGTVNITVNNSVISVEENNLDPTDSSKYGYYSAIFLEHLSGPTTINLTKANLNFQGLDTNKNFFNSLYMRNCAGTTKIKLNNTVLRSMSHPIIIENCTGTVTLEFSQYAEGTDPIIGMNQNGQPNNPAFDIIVKNCTNLTFKASYDNSPIPISQANEKDYWESGGIVTEIYNIVPIKDEENTQSTSIQIVDNK